MEKSKECKECCREISDEDYKMYNGYCKNCYKEHNKNSDNNSSLNTYHKISIFYFIIMVLSGIIAGFIIRTIYDEFNFAIMLSIILIGFITYFIFYMLATIIQEIRNK